MKKKPTALSKTAVLTRVQALFIILVLIVSISLNIWLYIQVEQLKTAVADLKSQGSLHTYTLRWGRKNISANTTIEGFVSEWTPDKPTRVMQISAWMGNPYGILWEGDIYVTLSPEPSQKEGPDKLLMHYQFDSHAGSPIPHQLTEDLRPGFLVNEGETIYVYRVFHSFDDETTRSGDGRIIIYYYSELKTHDPYIPENVSKIAEDMRVVIIESETENRIAYLDPNQVYCKVVVFHGGDNPNPWDLAYPNAPIVFFFLEDIEDPDKADNYSDFIVRMNPIIDEEDGKMKMVVVFFAEGGYEKLVYYQNQLLHHYRDEDPTSNYGIKLVEMNDP